MSRRRPLRWWLDYGLHRHYYGAVDGPRVFLSGHAWLKLLGGHVQFHVRWSKRPGGAQ